MNGMICASGDLCMPVVAMVDVLGQQEAKARIGPLPLPDGRLKSYAALLHSTGLASVLDQKSPQAMTQSKLLWCRQNASTCIIPCTPHPIYQLPNKNCSASERAQEFTFRDAPLQQLRRHANA